MFDSSTVYCFKHYHVKLRVSTFDEEHDDGDDDDDDDDDSIPCTERLTLIVKYKSSVLYTIFPLTKPKSFCQ